MKRQRTHLSPDAFRKAFSEADRPFDQLQQDVLAAFVATPDALHAQALEALEYVQALRLNPKRAADPLYLECLDFEWRQATVLPEVVEQVRRVVWSVRWGGSTPPTLP